MLQASIIIPTYNRFSILKKCLTALNHQKQISPREYEVIIIDDGSTDLTATNLKKISQTYKFPLEILSQSNLGQAAARNRGIKIAKAPITIFIGDDIIVDSSFVIEHLRLHNQFPELNQAVLGRIQWSPEIFVTPFMKWLTHGSNILGKFGGHQFAYEKLQNRTLADYNFFYTSNISLKTALLKKDPFDEDFGHYGWEDIELGYRLTKKYHLMLHYNRRALAYHYHPLDIDSLAPRMRSIGASAHIIHLKYPELKKVPSLSKKIIFYLLSNLLSINLIRLLNWLTHGRFNHLYFYALSKKYFLQGLARKSKIPYNYSEVP